MYESMKTSMKRGVNVHTFRVIVRLLDDVASLTCHTPSSDSRMFSTVPRILREGVAACFK
jgi:hypothetical protein